MIHLASRSPRRRVLLDQIGVGYTIVDAPIDEVRRAGEIPERFVERMAREKALAGIAALGGARVAPVLAADTAVVLDGQVLGKPRDAAHAAEMLRALSGRMHHVISAVAVAGAAGGRVETPRHGVHRRDAGAAAGEAPRFATDVGRRGAGTPHDGVHRRDTGTAAGEAPRFATDVGRRGAGTPHDGGHRRDAGTTDGEAPRFAVSVSRVWFREIGHDEMHAYCASGEPLDKAGAYAIQGRAAIFVARLDGSFSGVMGLPLFETASLLREAGVRVQARWTCRKRAPGAVRR